MRDTPYLVQRIRRAKDGDIELDWMGAAEFERGALLQCQGRMLEQASSSGFYQVRELTSSSGKKVWYIGVDVDASHSKEKKALEFLERELGPEPEIIEIDSPYRLKEKTFIRQVFSRPDFTKDLGKEIVGWWCIDERIEFAFFLERKDAENFVNFIREAK